MGAWGVHVFESDEGCDWLDEFLESQDESMLAKAFETVVGRVDYLELEDAANALAACEVVASINGKPGPSEEDTTRIAAWIDSRSPSDSSNLRVLAQDAIDRVLADRSEIAELWSDSDGHQQWLDFVSELRQRLR